MSNDTLDKLVIFLTKRDGIDNLVKTFQDVSKLVHWHVESIHPNIAQRFKQWEVLRGLPEKHLELADFLPASMLYEEELAQLQLSGSWQFSLMQRKWCISFFDHFLWSSRIGTLDSRLARNMSFISTFGKSFGYVFFVVADLIIREGVDADRRFACSKENSEEVRVEKRRSEQTW